MYNKERVSSVEEMIVASCDMYTVGKLSVLNTADLEAVMRILCGDNIFSTMVSEPSLRTEIIKTALLSVSVDKLQLGL